MCSYIYVFLFVLKQITHGIVLTHHKNKHKTRHDTTGHDNETNRGESVYGGKFEDEISRNLKHTGGENSTQIKSNQFNLFTYIQVGKFVSLSHNIHVMFQW